MGRAAKPEERANMEFAEIFKPYVLWGRTGVGPPPQAG